jgi:tetratricopeptide (TPR) repeat protein
MIGSAFIELGEVSLGQTYLQQALQVGESINDRVIVMQARRDLGMAAFRSGQFEEAIAQLQESLRLAKALGDRNSAAMSLYFMGAVEAHQQHFDEARAKIQECLDIRRELNDLYWTARAYNGLGEVALLRGDMADAQANYSAALPIFEQIGNQWWIAATYNNLGYGALGLGDPQTALAYLQNGLRGATASHAQPIIMEALAGFGLLLWKYGDDLLAWQIASAVLRAATAYTDARGKIQPAYDALKAKYANVDLSTAPPLNALLELLLTYQLAAE